MARNTLPFALQYYLQLPDFVHFSSKNSCQATFEANG